MIVAKWLDAELRNWGAWCRSGPRAAPPSLTHAASIEGRYLPPSDLSTVDDPPPPPPIPPDRARAEIIQDVYLHRLSDTERWALNWKYVRRVDDRVAIRKMRVTRRRYDTALLDAVRIVGLALRDKYNLGSSLRSEHGKSFITRKSRNT